MCTVSCIRSARVVAAALLLLMAAALHAESCKIGFVNTERILHDSEPARQAQERLKKLFQQKTEQLKTMKKDLDVLRMRLEKQVLVMSDTKRRDLERRFNDESRDFQKAQREANEELDVERNEEYQIIIDQANQVIKQIADRERYDIIFQEAVYVSEKIDITDQVVHALSHIKRLDSRDHL